MTEETPLNKRSITLKLLLTLLGFSVLIILILSIVSLVTINDLGKYSVNSASKQGEQAINDSITVLNSQTEKFLLNIVKAQAEISGNNLKKFQNEVNILVSHAERLINNPPLHGSMEIYSDKQEPEDHLKTCSYKLAPGVKLDSVRNEIEILNQMSDIFGMILDNDENIDSIFIGTESGVILSYPWDSGLSEDYDPRLRDWYKKAVLSSTGVWTDPYVEPLKNELIITFAKPFYNSKGKLQGVIEIDITMKAMNDRIVNTKIGRKGYAFLIDKNGKVIVRPDLKVNDTRWDETYETDCLLDTDNIDLKDIIQKMVSGETGVSKCVLDEEERFIAYAPVQNTGWSLGIVIPLKDILEPLFQTQTKLKNETEKSEDNITRKKRRLAVILLISSLLLLILIFIASKSISDRITDPILALNAGANIVGSGNLDYSLEIHTGDEIEDLANTFNKMTQNLKVYISDLKETTAEKERIESDLRIATEIQMSMLPTTFPPFPDRNEFDIFASMVPAKEVGGDFYDFFFISQDELCFVIGDVSGKGVPAALFMAITKTLIKTEVSRGISPETALFNVNSILISENKACMFVTVFCCILNVRTGELRFANAGHNPPVISKAGNPAEFLKEESGFVLGVMPGIKFGTGKIHLNSNDLLLLYTDGVTEANNEKKELFSNQRLIDIVNRIKLENTEKIIQEIKVEINAFAGNEPQSDDITMLAIRYYPAKPEE
ncbi:MAG: SpoIIE family protein phosphatase [bacterium]|nr:SpoIIE family protein phosphatase [bacterium]